MGAMDQPRAYGAHPVLEKALRNGFRLETLKNLARTPASELAEHSRSEMRSSAIRRTISGEDSGITSSRRRSYLQNVLKPEGQAGRPPGKSTDLAGAARKTAHELSKPGSAGAAKNWTGRQGNGAGSEGIPPGSGGISAHPTRAFPTQQLLHEVVCWIKDDFMVNEWEKRKQDGGLLDFDDQLRLARDLLLKNKTVRREFQHAVSNAAGGRVSGYGSHSVGNRPAAFIRGYRGKRFGQTQA